MTPFDVPEIKIPKLGRLHVITLLRQHISKYYMPSAMRATYTTRPEYIEDYIFKLSSLKYYPFYDGTGYYKNTDTEGVWVFINTTPVQLLCELQTDKLYVRLDQEDAEWHLWTPELQVAINPLELKERVEEHL